MIVVDPTIMVAIIGAIESIGVAIIGGIVTRTNRANERYRKKREELDKRREERDEALYALLFADSTGTEVLLHQAHGDHLNGNVEDALKSISKAKGRLNNICNREIAKL